MPNFTYRAKTSSGTHASGTIAAGNAREAMKLLRQQALFPVDVQDEIASASSWENRLVISRRIKGELIADTLTQLSDLLNGGVSLLESLAILAEQSPDERLKEVLADIRDQV